MVPKSSGLKMLTRSVARRNKAAVARQAIQNTGIRKCVMAILACNIQKEMTLLCSRKTSSMLRASSMDSLSKFSWKALSAELESISPTLYGFLKGCVQVKRKATKAMKSIKPADVAVLGVCACILLRHRNTRMNAMQRAISLVLHRGHSSKQVINILYEVLEVL